MLSSQKNDFINTGKEIYNLMERLFPVCRSITGDGVRQTLDILSNFVPLKKNEVASGARVFDWEVPMEWNIKDAYIKNKEGKRIVDFKKSNLHVLNYSIPVSKQKITLSELKKHLFSLPDHPDWIPYLTSYYNQNWGFCLTQNQLDKLKDPVYEIFIDSSLKRGALSLGEFFIKGKSREEILFTSYICHPSLCNDNLSGPTLLTVLAKYLAKEKPNYSYRFLFIPETIGAIAWLSGNEKKANNIKCGLVATCVGDKGKSTYKKTLEGNNLIDKISEKVLLDSGSPYNIIDFLPAGSDERQFSSPGFRIPMGTLSRTIYGKFPEYHTSADNLSFVDAESLGDSFKKYWDIIFTIENNKTYLTQNPKCEPQLGKRGVYRLIGGQKQKNINEDAMLAVLMLSDGKHSLLDIAVKANIKFLEVKNSADILTEKKLLKEVKHS